MGNSKYKNNCKIVFNYKFCNINRDVNKVEKNVEQVKIEPEISEFQNRINANINDCKNENQDLKIEFKKLSKKRNINIRK